MLKSFGHQKLIYNFEIKIWYVEMGNLSVRDRPRMGAFYLSPFRIPKIAQGFGQAAQDFWRL